MPYCLCTALFIIRAEAVLGAGEFGEVFKGTWETPYGPQEVAIKKLKEGSTEKDKATFLQEAAIMAQFRHPHIVRLLGAITVDEPVSNDYTFCHTCSFELLYNMMYSTVGGPLANVHYCICILTTTCASRVSASVGHRKRPPVQVTVATTTCASRVSALVGHRKRPPVQVTVATTTCASRVSALVGH